MELSTLEMHRYAASEGLRLCYLYLYFPCVLTMQSEHQKEASKDSQQFLKVSVVSYDLSQFSARVCQWPYIICSDCCRPGRCDSRQ